MSFIKSLTLHLVKFEKRSNRAKNEHMSWSIEQRKCLLCKRFECKPNDYLNKLRKISYFLLMYGVRVSMRYESYRTTEPRYHLLRGATFLKECTTRHEVRLSTIYSYVENIRPWFLEVRLITKIVPGRTSTTKLSCQKTARNHRLFNIIQTDNP